MKWPTDQGALAVLKREGSGSSDLTPVGRKDPGDRLASFAVLNRLTVSGGEILIESVKNRASPAQVSFPKRGWLL
jgi:hypothetical protein